METPFLSSASMSFESTLILASIAGIIVHLGLFNRGEWHLEAPHVVVGHVLLIIVSLLDAFRERTASQLLPHVICFSAAYLGSLFFSILVYRLSPLHRLHHFPGPRLAAASKLWHVWQCRDSRNHEVMRNLHDEYGDFVRTGPSELASFHPDTIAVLEGFGTQCTKSDFYDLLLPDHSLVFTRNKPLHDARRQVWRTALSASAIDAYRPRIERQIAVLLQRILEAATTQSTVLVSDMIYWYAFDSMGEFAFNQDFGMMRRQEWHFAVTLSRRALSLVGPFSPAMWLIKIGFAFAPWFSNIRAWLAMLSFCNDQMEARTKTRPTERDIASYFIEEAQTKGHSKNMQRWMQGDAATVIVAGSDTTAPQLIFLLYLIAQNPDAADKISTELADVEPMDLNAVSRLPHLNGVINEALRLYSAVPTAVSRQTPPQGVMLGDTWIPGDTKVIIPRWVISRREDCFVRAEDFIPERWYSKPELVKHRRAFAPFGTGHASCVGQGLAMTQLRLILASVVKRYHVRFPPGGQDGREVLRDMKDQLTAKPGELRLVFERRDRKTASG